jgi:hypothetical protein
MHTVQMLQSDAATHWDCVVIAVKASSLAKDVIRMAMTKCACLISDTLSAFLLSLPISP